MFEVLFTILPFMVCLFWTAVFVLGWRTANPAKRVLTVFMAVCSVLYFCHALFFNGENVPFANSIYAFCNLSVFPLYYIYICRLTDTKPLLRVRRLIVLLSLPVIVGIWAAIDDILFPGGSSSECVRLLVAKCLFFLQVLPICYFGYKRLRDFDWKIENLYSNTEQRSVKQTRRIMVVLVVCSICSIAVNHLGRDYFFANPAVIILPSLLFSSLLFGVGYVGERQVFCIGDMEEEEAEQLQLDDECLENEPEDLKENSQNALLLKVENLMTEKQLFLQSDLRLSEVATQLGIGRTALSSLINQSAGMSFSDYVNTFRIRYAQDILKHHPKSRTLSLIQISEMSGFSSESSFYRAFRKQTGQTPKQWSEENT